MHELPDGVGKMTRSDRVCNGSSLLAVERFQKIRSGERRHHLRHRIVSISPQLSVFDNRRYSCQEDSGRLDCGGMKMKVSARAAVQCSIVVAALVGACLAWLLLPIEEAVGVLTTWIHDRGFWGVLVFALVYIVVVVVLAPASALSIAAGFVFGLWGVPIVVFSAAIGANLAFLVSRHVIRRKVRLMAAELGWFEAADQAVKEEGWKIVLLLRLSPLVPFGLQNYLMGVTSISGSAYAASTFIGIIPGTALYVYLGTLGRVAMGDESASTLKMTLMFAGLIASAYAIVIVGRKARARLSALGMKDRARCSDLS